MFHKHIVAILCFQYWNSRMQNTDIIPKVIFTRQYYVKYKFIIFRQNRWRLPFVQMLHLTVKRTMTRQYKAVRSHLILKIFCISRYDSSVFSNKINIVVVFWFYWFLFLICVCIFV